MGMGGKPQTTTQTNTVTLSPEQRELMNMAMPFMRQWANTPYQSYGKSTIADFSPDELKAMGLYRSQAEGPIADLASQAYNTQQKLLDPNQLNPANNPWLKDMSNQIREQVQGNLLGNALPRIRQTSVGTGGMYGGGSTRAGLAEGAAVGDAASATGDALSNLYFNSYNSGLQSLRQAVDANPGVMSQQLFGADVLSAVGAQERGMSQAKMDEEYKNWAMKSNFPLMRAQELMQLFGAFPTAGGTSTVTGQSQSPSGFMSGLGGAMAGSSFGPWGMGIGALMGLLGSRMR